MFGLNLVMLLGLAGLAIPPIIHLLNRRRYDVVHWGAMQFLQISETTRRRLLIEEILLMAVRMFLIALLVLALASPFVLYSAFDRLGLRENRDVVIVLDGSASMSTRNGDSSVDDEARHWARDYLNQLIPGDAVAIVQAKQRVIPIVGALTHDLDRARSTLDDLPPPAGSCDFPLAVDEAFRILATSKRPLQEIVVVTDGQRRGWADEPSLARWQRLGRKLDESSLERTHLWVVNVQGERSAAPPNWILEDVRSGRALASQRLFFESELKIHGEHYEPPHEIRLELDGVQVRTLTAPKAADLRNGTIPVSFEHAFTPGSHLVSLIVEPDPPEAERPAGYVVKDQVPADNRQDFAVMARLLPVLLVDGGAEKPKQRGADLLLTALQASEPNTSLVRPKLVAVGQLTAAHLSAPIGPEPDTRPRVLVLCNVAELSSEQRQAIDDFVQNGGRVLVTLGQRVNADHYNHNLYRQGQGWLPVALEQPQGDEFAPLPVDTAAPDPAAHPLKANYTHPALRLLSSDSSSDLDRARFPRWWKVAEGAPSTSSNVIARFDNHQPFLIERSFGKGEVILSTVPLDESWNTNLHRGVSGTTPLLHELIYYLIGARAIEYNLLPGRPLVYQPIDDESPGSLTLQLPRGEKKSLDADHWPLVYAATQEPGVYRLTTPAGRLVYYVVQPDTQDGEDLTTCTSDDRKAASDILAFRYEKDVNAILRGPGQPVQLWWWLLIGLTLILCFEVWMTRRITRGSH